MKHFLPLLAMLCIMSTLEAQNSVGIGTSSPNNSALLDLNSSSKGFLAPRMSTSSRLNIVNPAAGLIVYDTNTDTYWFFDNGRWNELVSSNKLTFQLPSNRINPNGQADHNFGFSVCLGSSGTTGFVGSPMLGIAGAGTCHRITYADNNLWTLSTMNPAGLAAGDGYGYAVAMDRQNSSALGVVSAPFDDSAAFADVGSVYFFDNSTFINKAYAPLAQRVAGARFGRSVDISGAGDLAYAIVGSPGANANKGAAFIYQYNPNTQTWDYEATLTDNLGAAADSFGVAVSLYFSATGDTAWAFIGAPYDDENTFTDNGSVTVYRKAAGSATWTRVAKLISPIADDDGQYGASISNTMKCGQVYIGAPMYSSGIGRMLWASLSSLVGSVATFTQATLPSSGSGAGNGNPGYGFCSSAMPVSASGCNDIFLLVGSYSGIITASTSATFGVASLLRYLNGNWSHIEKLTDPDVETTGYGFGRAVSVHTGSKYMLIGSPNQRVDGMVNRGKVQFRKLVY